MLDSGEIADNSEDSDFVFEEIGGDCHDATAHRVESTCYSCHTREKNLKYYRKENNNLRKKIKDVQKANRIL